MAELDYAFLAEYASIRGGTLTAVGASFTYLEVPAFPVTFKGALAGRVRTRTVEAVTLQLTVRGADGLYEIKNQAALEPTPGQRSYGDDIIGNLFAIDLLLPVPEPGLYEFLLYFNFYEEPVRRLAFEAIAHGAT